MITIELEEGQRQALLLAIAKLSQSRPGWHDACLGPIADKLGGRTMYESFRKLGIEIPMPVKVENLLDGANWVHALQNIALKLPPIAEIIEQMQAKEFESERAGQPVPREALKILTPVFEAAAEFQRVCREQHG